MKKKKNRFYFSFFYLPQQLSNIPIAILSIAYNSTPVNIAKIISPIVTLYIYFPITFLGYLTFTLIIKISSITQHIGVISRPAAWSPYIANNMKGINKNIAAMIEIIVPFLSNSNSFSFSSLLSIIQLPLLLLYHILRKYLLVSLFLLLIIFLFCYNKIGDIMICPKCHTSIKDDNQFCVNCGVAIESNPSNSQDMDVCPNCNMNVKKGSEYCLHCGTKFGIIPKSTKEEEAQYIKPIYKSNNLTTFIACLLINIFVTPFLSFKIFDWAFEGATSDFSYFYYFLIFASAGFIVIAFYTLISSFFKMVIKK